jgi:uncharacterized protein (DUF362 family)
MEFNRAQNPVNSIPMRRFGKVRLGRVKEPADMRAFLPDSCLEADTVIVKPNWYSLHPGNFTDAETLRTLLEALDSRAVVIEGYTLERHDGNMAFRVDGEKVNWRWIMRHPDWGWVREEGRWQEIRRQDDWFLEEYGFRDLFDELGAEYVNVTEEAWAGRNVDPATVKEAIERRFRPAFTEKLYGFLPRRLHDLKGSPLISLGKVKGIGGTYPSLTLKNLFGLVPDPLRTWWHGPRDSRLSSSIVDIAKVYASFFQLHGVCEAINTLTVSNPEGEVKTAWGNYDVVRDLGVVASGPDLVTLDAVLCGLIRVDPEKVGYLQKGEEEFGAYDRAIVQEARAVSSDWFPVN